MSLTRTFIPAADAISPLFVGIDLGGTNIKLGLVDNLGRPLAWESIPTESGKGPEETARRMGLAVRAMIAAGFKSQDIAGVGLGQRIRPQRRGLPSPHCFGRAGGACQA